MVLLVSIQCGVAAGAFLYRSCFGMPLVGGSVLLVGLVLWWALWPYVTVYETSDRRAARTCRTCGYDLRATPDRCPECGTTTAPP